MYCNRHMIYSSDEDECRYCRREGVIDRSNYAQNFEQSWNNIKNEGEQHHKTGGVEPIDLYKDGEMLRDFAICSIMKYAFRNRRQLRKPINPKDLGKIIHFTKMLGFIAEKEAACGKKTE